MVQLSAAPAANVFAHGRNRVTYQLLAGREIDEALDFGCGGAEFARALGRELGLVVHACDINAELIGKLDQLQTGVHFFAIAEDRPELPLADGQVSAITCCDVLEHMPPRSRSHALAEMRRVLAEDGILVLTTPHRSPLSWADPENVKFNFPRLHKAVYLVAKGRARYQARYGGERYGNFTEGAEKHMHFSATELSEMLSSAGFEVDEVRYFRLFYPFVRTLLWASESLAGRVPGGRAFRRAMWRAYTWDADLEPGRLGDSIAIRARKTRGPAPAAY